MGGAKKASMSDDENDDGEAYATAFDSLGEWDVYIWGDQTKIRRGRCVVVEMG